MTDSGTELLLTESMHSVTFPVIETESGIKTKAAFVVVMYTEQGWISLLQRRVDGLLDFTVCGTLEKRDGLYVTRNDAGVPLGYGEVTIIREIEEELGQEAGVHLNEVLNIEVLDLARIPYMGIFVHHNVTTQQAERFMVYPFPISSGTPQRFSDIQEIISREFPNIEVVPVRELQQEGITITKRLQEYLEYFPGLVMKYS